MCVGLESKKRPYITKKYSQETKKCDLPIENLFLKYEFTISFVFYILYIDIYHICYIWVNNLKMHYMNAIFYNTIYFYATLPE